MFAKIRKKLVVVNATVILIVLALLSTLIYAHMRYRLYHDTDEILKLAQARIQSFADLSALLQSGRPDPAQDETTTYLFWNRQGKLIGQMPQQSFPDSIVSFFKPAFEASSLRTLAAGGHHYRILVFKQSSHAIASIGIVRSLDDARSTLHALKMDIISAIIAGVLISVLTGFFLAGRSLVPIRKSWEKQQRFVADASHELRTPTAIIHAQTELLLRNPAHSIEQEADQIAAILKESNRMNRLLDNLLTLARSDSNQLQLQSSFFKLDELVQEIAERFRLLAETKNVTVRYAAEQPVLFWGDEGRIRQLLIILMDNALKYTPESGTVEIRTRIQTSFLVIRVSDNGCGIADRDLPFVFDRFYRGDQARSRAEGGTGLGLSIAHWIAYAHGGTISIESTVNEGTIVELRLPRKKYD
ncbi:sensor histidine kinase [Paenibacillus glycinis]|uniref:histidine kinase n=1 Tax=Paenibacillus glycinis TaxID=2697035 RepID=A0ABW9XRA2_9BACL|nr:ATP-binding protein [Paenibacillus glycinis]NBD25008.1 sensor histidine kinase [Paenibacillus glycinis]